MIVTSIFMWRRGGDKQPAHIEVVRRQAQRQSITSSLSSKDEMIECIHAMDEKLGDLKRENDQLRRENRSLKITANDRSERSSSRISPLAVQILLKFCELDTTEFMDADLYRRVPQEKREAERALAELCAMNLLVEEIRLGSTRYVINSRGQHLAYSYARDSRPLSHGRTTRSSN